MGTQENLLPRVCEKVSPEKDTGGRALGSVSFETAIHAMIICHVSARNTVYATFLTEKNVHNSITGEEDVKLCCNRKDDCHILLGRTLAISL